MNKLVSQPSSRDPCGLTTHTDGHGDFGAGAGPVWRQHLEQSLQLAPGQENPRRPQLLRAASSTVTPRRFCDQQLSSSQSATGRSLP